MVKKKSGSLSSRVKKSVAAHKADETDYGRIEIPGGIRNGVAKLVDCKFDKYKTGVNEGEYYFLAAGVVVEPKQNEEGVPVVGLRTQIMIPVCATTNRNGVTTDVDAHVASILNEMRKLGINTEEIGDEDLEEAAELLKEESPYFKFSTTQSKPTEEFPDPRVWENWHGVKGLENYIPEDDEDVEDNTEDDEEEETEEKTEEKNLGELAEEGDKDAQIELEKLCDKAGVDPEDFGTWVEVFEALEGSEEEEEEEEETLQPDKGEMYFYKPPKKRKSVEVEVTAVFKTKKTVNLKNAEDNKTVYKGVTWEKLKTEE